MAVMGVVGGGQAVGGDNWRWWLGRKEKRRRMAMGEKKMNSGSCFWKFWGEE